MKRYVGTALAAVLVMIAAEASAQTVPAELTSYNDIMVNLSETAEECNLKDETVFADRVREKLAEIGIEENPQSVITVNVGISAKAFGVLRTECTSLTEIAFNTMLTADNIVTDSEAVRAAVDRLKQFPVTVYRLARFGVQAQVQPAAGGDSVATERAVLSMIDEIVDKVGSQR